MSDFWHDVILDVFVCEALMRLEQYPGHRLSILTKQIFRRMPGVVAESPAPFRRLSSKFHEQIVEYLAEFRADSSPKIAQ